MAGNRNLMNHCRNEAKGIEWYIGTSYDHLVKVSENMDKIIFIADNLEGILEGIIVNSNEVINNIQKEGENMLAGIQDDMNAYVEKFGKDIDIIIDERFSFIDETLTGIEHNSEFAIRQREFEARIGKVETIIANDQQANASMREELEVKYADNTAKIEEFKQVIATNEQVQSEFYRKVDLELYEGNMKLLSMEKSILTSEKAWGVRADHLEGRIGENEANIETVYELTVTNSEAVASALTELTAEVGDNSASIKDLKEIIVNDGGSTAQQINELRTEMITKIDEENKKLDKKLDSEIIRVEKSITTLESATAEANLNLKTEVNQSLKEADTKIEEYKSETDASIVKSKNDAITESRKFTETSVKEVDTRVTSEIENLNKTISELDFASAESVTTLKSELEQSSKETNTKIEEYKKETDASIIKSKGDAVTESKKYTDEKIVVVDTRISSEITNVNKTITELEKTSAEASTSLKSELENKITTTETRIEEVNTTVVDNKKATDAAITKGKNDAITESKKYTDQKITVVDSRISSEITNVNKTITELEKTSAESTNTLRSEMETVKTETTTRIEQLETSIGDGVLDSITFKDTKKTNQKPSWYVKNHPKRIVYEIKTSSVVGLPGGTATVLADVSTTVPYDKVTDGSVYQDATIKGKTYTRFGNPASTADTWSAWIEGESVVGAQAKADKAKADAIKNSKTYTDQQIVVIDTKLGSEITNVNKTITELEKTSAEASTTLRSELEQSITTTNTTVANNKKATDAAIAKSKTDAVADSKKYTDAEVKKVNTKMASEITNVNKTISDLEKTTAQNSLTLKSELQAEIDRSALTTKNELEGQINSIQGDISEVIGKDIEDLQKEIFDLNTEIVDAVSIKDTRSKDELPAWYYANYPQRRVTEFKSNTAIKLPGFTSGYADLTTTVSWRDNSGGHIYQTAVSAGKTFTRYGGSRNTTYQDKWTSWVEVESAPNAQTKANKAKTDAVKDSNTYTDNTAKSLTTTINNTQKDLDGKITTTNGTVTQNKIELDKKVGDVGKKVDDATEIKYLTGTAKVATPEEYVKKYGKMTVTEFGVGSWFNLTAGRWYTVETRIAFQSGLDQGRVIQRATENLKSNAVVTRERKSASATTWTAWVVSETTSGSQTKANKAKTDAVADSKKYTDAESTKINATITAEIKQVNQTIANVDGTVAAMTKLTAETSVLGERVISGIAFGSDGKQASFKIFADKFAIVSTDGRVEVPAFTSTMVGGKAVIGINGDLFVKGTIDANVIKAKTTLTGAYIVGGSLNIGSGKFTVSTAGVVNIRADAKKNVGLQITNERIDVYDENGRLRVRLGKLV